MNIRKLCCIFIILATQSSGVLSELLTIGIGGLVIAGAYFSYCQFTECCDDKYIPYDVDKLRSSLQTSLYGQPLAMEIVNILQGHKESINRNHGGKKALGISMHGWPGTGKNYVAEFVAKSLFKKGMDSNYVNFYIGRRDFPNNDSVSVSNYQVRLKNEIHNLVKSCRKALVIFDEVNDIPAGVLDVLKPLMDYHEKVDNVDYRDVVFLFLSNLNGNEIAHHFLKLNKPRDSLVMADFEDVLRKGAYKADGGFKGAQMIYAQLIDHYIPFLPLEQVHVEKCIRTEFQMLGVHHPQTELIESVMSIMSFGPTDSNPIFANAGCKRVRNQISYVMQKHKQYF